MDETTTTLFINRFDSRCGACNKGANPNEERHTTKMGYGASGPGCGAKFVRLSSDYGGPGIKKSATNLRPDLPWVDYFDAVSEGAHA